MTGLFPAEFDTVLAHSGGNIGIADWGDFGLDVVALGPVEEALIGHDSNSDLVEGKEVGEESDDLVAIYDIRLTVNKKATIAVAIVSDAEV